MVTKTDKLEMTRIGTIIANTVDPRSEAGGVGLGALLPIILVLTSPIAGAEAPA